MLLGSVVSRAKRRRSVSLRLGLGCALSLSAFLVYACGGDDTSDAGGTSALDGSGGSPAADVAVAPTDGSALTATVRFVHLAANLGSVDFCLRGAGDETFTGPVLGATPNADGGQDASTSSTDGGAEDGGTADSADDAAGDASADATSDGGSKNPVDTALMPRTMTNYVSFAGSGTFDVAVIAAGQKSCASPLATLKVTVDPSKLTTVVLAGDFGAGGSSVDAGDAGDAGGSVDAGDAGAGTLRLFRVLDDPTIDSKQARLRMVNAAYGASSVGVAPDLRVDLIGSQKTPIAVDVPLGSVANQSVSAPTTDAVGYTLIAPEPPANAFSLTGIGDAGFSGSWTSVYTDLGLVAASLHTGFIVSDSNDTLTIVWCSDTSTIGKRVDCRILGKPAGDL